MPEITVLMPVRNGEKYIKDAIDSTLKQSFEDFELLIIDDGSTDQTISIITKYTDSRIRLIRKEPDFIRTLNDGLSLSQGQFIARMDADDIMHTERLRIQHKRMSLDPDIAVATSWAKVFKDSGTPLSSYHFGDGYIENPVLQMLRGNIFIHPTAMLRKSFLEENQLRYENYEQAEDYKLWFEVAKVGGKFFVEPQHLLNFRVSDTQITHVKRDSMIRQTIRIKKEILHYLLNKPGRNKALLKLYNVMEENEKENTITPHDTLKLFWDILVKE